MASGSKEDPPWQRPWPNSSSGGHSAAAADVETGPNGSDIGLQGLRDRSDGTLSHDGNDGDGDGDDDDGFVSYRKNTKVSILPHTNFLTPKKRTQSGPSVPQGLVQQDPLTMPGFGFGAGPSTSVLGSRGEPQPLPATAADGMPRSSVDTVPSIRSMPSRGHRSANARGHPRGATLAAGGYYGSKGWQNGYASQTSTDSEMFSMPARLTRSNTKRGEPLLEEPFGVSNATCRESKRSQSASRTGRAGLSNGENQPSDASSPGHSSAQRLDQTSLSQRPSLQATQLPSSYLHGPASLQDHKQKQRLYRSHKGSNHFFIGGRLITADSNPAYFIASTILLAALGGLWLGFEASYVWHEINPAPVIIFGYLWLSTMVNMQVASWRDPGIIPREIDPDPQMSGPDGRRNIYDPEDPLYHTVPRVIRIRNEHDFTSKWCETCKVYRPPRSIHCRTCDNCVDLIDHHCTYLNTCVARFSYTPFFAFLIYASLASILALVLCALHLSQAYSSAAAASSDGILTGPKRFQSALQTTPMSAVLFLLILFVFVPVATLLSYHIRLIVVGVTMAEQIRINLVNSETRCVGMSCDIPTELRPSATASRWRNLIEVLARPSVSTGGAYVQWRSKVAAR